MKAAKLNKTKHTVVSLATRIVMSLNSGAVARETPAEEGLHVFQYPDNADLQDHLKMQIVQGYR